MRFYKSGKLTSFWCMIQYVFFDLQHAIICCQYGAKTLKILQTRHPQIMPSGVQIEQVLGIRAQKGIGAPPCARKTENGLEK